MYWLFGNKSELSAESCYYIWQSSNLPTGSNCEARFPIQIWKHYKDSKTNTAELSAMLQIPVSGHFAPPQKPHSKKDPQKAKARDQARITYPMAYQRENIHLAQVRHKSQTRFLTESDMPCIANN